MSDVTAVLFPTVLKAATLGLSAPAHLQPALDKICEEFMKIRDRYWNDALSNKLKYSNNVIKTRLRMTEAVMKHTETKLEQKSTISATHHQLPQTMERRLIIG